MVGGAAKIIRHQHRPITGTLKAFADVLKKE
jgi:hypothetical protein